MSFEAGDKVFHVLNGEGEVVEVGFTIIKVESEKWNGSYYLDGRVRHDDKFPSIYHAGTTITPAPEPNRYAKKQAKWVEENGIKVGDMVRITRNWEKGELGFTECLHPCAPNPTGEEMFRVDFIHETAIVVDGWHYPYFVLEKVEQKYDFKPFDKVLVRDVKGKYWMPSFFASVDDDENYPFNTIDRNVRKYCIHYEGNEHLCGTTDNE